MTMNQKPGTAVDLSSSVARAAESAQAGRGVAPEPALDLAESARLDELLFAAGRVREAHFGNKVDCCSILSVKTGRCSEDCGFCAQSGRYRTEVQPTGLLDELAVRRAAQEARDNRASALGLVSSGCGVGAADLDAFCERLAAVREEGLAMLHELGLTPGGCER
jgi:biotin synthase